MSEETKEAVFELPKPTSEKQKLTFTVPHILKSITLDEAGFTHREIREGGPRQIEFETTHEYSETPVEKEDVFSIKAANQLNFAGSVINVLNDEVKLADGFQLVPTSPTASEYMALIGQRVQTASMCDKDISLSKQAGKDVFRIAKAFITSLP